MSKRNSKFEWETSFIQSGITGNAGLIGLLMATLDNGDGRGCRASARSVSRWTGLNEKTVRNNLALLMSSGWLVRTSTGGRRGGRVFSSEYQLAIPEGFYRPKLSSQQELVSSQPEPATPQQGARTHPLDQVSLNQPSLNPIDVASLQPGDQVTEKELLKLHPRDREMFVPGFTDNDVWLYEPEITARASEAARVASASSPAPTQGQKRRLIESNRQEGLDENGQQLKPRSQTARYRSRR